MMTHSYGVEIEFGSWERPQLPRFVDPTRDRSVSTGLPYDSQEWRIGGPSWDRTAVRIALPIVGQCLAEAGAGVDSSCGLHIHVGGWTSSTLEELSKVWRKVESAIVNAITGGDPDMYCREGAAMLWEGRDLIDYKSHQLSLGIYESMKKFGTVEFRLFYGTINEESILQALDMVDWVLAQVHGEEGPMPPANHLQFQDYRKERK